MISRLYLFLILTTLVQFTTAQPPAASIRRNSYRIPFELTEHNNLSVQLMLNKQDTVRLMFHTAASSALIIGQEKLTTVPAGFFAGAIGRQKMSIIGFDVLKRFNLLIDAQRTHIYLRPNKLKRTGYMNV